MPLKPQDLFVVLKLLSVSEKRSYNQLAIELGMSPSEVHAAAKRALVARLLNLTDEDGLTVNRRNLEEFLIHGVMYAFPPERGAMTRGIPTAHAAAPLDQWITATAEPPPVWPDPEGSVRGQAFSPLYRSVPFAARQDPVLHEYLALTDALRGGQVRERNLAAKELQKRLHRHARSQS